MDLAQHFNLCLSRARGKYFVILCDDDLITPEYIGSLVRRFEAWGSATVGIGRCEIIDKAGAVTRRFPLLEQDCYPGPEFLINWLWGKLPDPRPAWISMFMRTDMARAIGGFLETPVAAHADNALFIALALQGDVVFAKEGCFQYRVYMESYGLSVSYQVLAKASEMLVDYMKTNPVVVQQMAGLSERQRQLLCQGVARIAARTYLYRLSAIYFPALKMRDFLIAIFSTYRFDSQYLRAFPRFIVAFIKHRTERLLKRGRR
jgi:glycosyltransferase involved in cell wall biosynthesis